MLLTSLWTAYSTLLPVAASLSKRVEPINATSPTAATLPYNKVYQFPPPSWIENIAIRPNGNLLPIRSLATSSQLVQLNPANGELSLVYDFAHAGNSLQGITEVVPDLFVVEAVTCNLTALDCTNGTFSVWSVDFREQGRAHGHHYFPATEGRNNATVRLVAEFSEAGFLNGMAALDEGTVLIADSFLGGVWSLDVYTGAKELLFTDAALSPLAAASTGVNGIRVRSDKLYFTNSKLATFGVLPIDAKTGRKTGNATIIADGLLGPDDFEIDSEGGVAYLANGVASQLLKIALNSSFVEVVASVPGPTSARWSPLELGEEKRALYVSTVGGLGQYVLGNITIGGAIERFEISL